MLRLYQPTALKVTTTIDGVVAGDVSGQLFVEGTSTRHEPLAGVHERVRQRARR